MRVRTGDFIRFGEYLATHLDLGDASANALSRELELPYTTVVEWWHHLEYHRALLVAHRNVRVDRPRLLQVLAAHRLPRLTPATRRPIALDAHELSRELTRRKVPHALAILSAANEWAFFEPRRSVQVFLPRSHLPVLSEIAPFSEASGAIEMEAFSENVTSLPVERRGGLPVTSVFLTILDCRAHPEGGAHAHFLETNVLKWRPARAAATGRA